MKSSLSYIAAFVSILSSCCYTTEFRTLKLDLSHQNENIPKITDQKFIRLEKGVNAMIGQITKVDFFENRFYVLDDRYSKSLFVYDSSGNFINNTSIGRGPGEVTHPCVFNFDSDSNQVLLWDQGMRKMLTYSIDLGFLHSFSSENLILWDFERISSHKFFTYTQNAGNAMGSTHHSYYYYFLRDGGGKVIEQYLPCYKPLRNYILRSPIWKNETETLFVTPFDFTIYSYCDGEVKPYIHIDFGPFELNAKQIKRKNFIYEEYLTNDEKLVAIDYIINTTKFLAFSYQLAYKNHFIIYSKARDEIYYSEKLFEGGALPKCELHSFNGNQFIGVVEPIHYLEYLSNLNEITNPVVNPNEMDNPYLITFKIK